MHKKRFDYELIFIEYLKRKKGGVADIRTIAKELKLPKAYLEKVARKLKRAGFVMSRRGARGGYWLAKDAGAISIGTLIEFHEPLRSFCPLLRKMNK